MERYFERLARAVTRWAGSTSATLLAFLSVLVWTALGPFFDFSSDYQMIINTATTIVTFLMVFLIQRMQNKESLAIHLKLNEIIAAIQGASNRLINVENLSEEEVQRLHERYQSLADRLACGGKRQRTASHSIEEAEVEVPPELSEPQHISTAPSKE